MHYGLHILLYCVIGYINPFLALNIVDTLKGQPHLPDILFSLLPQISPRIAHMLLVGSCIYFMLRLLYKRCYEHIINLIKCANTLFFIRMFTFTVTTMPPSLLNCASRNPGDPIKWNVVEYLHYDYVDTCFDLMFSGHASYLTFMLLYILKYSNSKWEKRFAIPIYIISIVSISAARIHYTSDIIVGIALTYFVFEKFVT